MLRHNGVLVATLNAGEVYYRGDWGGYSDMTGAHITANKLVAFFAQSSGTAIPLSGIGDILFQQLAPVNTWSKRFFVPVTLPGTDYVRIVVSQNNTSISQIGGTIRTDAGGQPTLTHLQAGQFVELEILLSNNGCFIDADKPVGFCYFMQSRSNYNLLGSCSQVWIPSIEQSVSKILTVPFDFSIYGAHYAIVCAPTTTRDNTMVSIGGAPPVPLSGDIWHNHTAGMSFYNFLLTNFATSYLFSNPAKIIVLGYGLYNPSVAYKASYYYLAGSAMRVRSRVLCK